MNMPPIKLFADGFGFLHQMAKGIFVEVVCTYKPDNFNHNTYFNCNVYHNGYSIQIEDLKPE